MYWDYFKNIYVDKKETIAPPERYLPIICGENMYIETWKVADNQYLDIAYKTRDEVHSARNAMCNKHNCQLRDMVMWIIPKADFMEYAKRCDVEVGDLDESSTND